MPEADELRSELKELQESSRRFRDRALRNLEREEVKVARLLAACESALALVEQIEPEMLDGMDDVPGLLREAIARAKES